MSADAISRLITNITLVVRSGMRHTRNGEPTWRRAESTEEKWLLCVCSWTEAHYHTLSLPVLLCDYK
ncbi:Growth hormone receptor [Dissostichus eleginoides]|uniref:Growth hormone receptor n=1 Tax=Dissostichus eleginoides TaxID=100907 RepID=A0AAD9BQP3_DISEL|nr:Growth hormone receptor [Dissostichus eleginoides]